jgi:hypothetical protein
MCVRVLIASALALLLVSCGGSAERPRTVSTTAADACGSWASPADSDSRLIGATRDSTEIRVAIPADLRAGTEVRLDWHMTSSPGTTALAMYAERAELGTSTARVQPRRVEQVDSENDYAVYITLPEAGCWRMHGERAGGKLSGDIWLAAKGR